MTFRSQVGTFADRGIRWRETNRPKPAGMGRPRRRSSGYLPFNSPETAARPRQGWIPLRAIRVTVNEAL